MPTVPVQALSKARAALVRSVQGELEGIQHAGTYKAERVLTSSQSALIQVQQMGSRRLLNFCANNYLGLSDNPQLKLAAKTAIDSHGLGLSSVRFICGTQDLHKTLEHRIAGHHHHSSARTHTPHTHTHTRSTGRTTAPAHRPPPPSACCPSVCLSVSVSLCAAFHGSDDAILYASCFDANAGIFETLFSADDCIISDALNHASIIDGIRLSKARRLRYRHLDLADLEAQLQSTDASTARHRVIVTDGVFSMDGHIAPLADIVALAERYNALTFIDECHATGFFGPTGRGTDEYCGVQGQIDLINSTLGKAMGGACGGYTASHQSIVDLLRQRSRPYLFSNALPPAVVGASIACFDMLSNSTELRDRLESNTRSFRRAMEAAGFDLAGSKDHPIVPIMLGDAKLAATFAEEMLKGPPQPHTTAPHSRCHSPMDRWMGRPR